VQYKWVPQVEQNQRVPCYDEANDAGSPETTRKSPFGITIPTYTGAPLIRRQIVQWQ